MENLLKGLDIELNRSHHFPYQSLDRPSQNIKTGKGYSNLITPLNGAWWDKDFIQHWAQNMKDNTKVTNGASI